MAGLFQWLDDYWFDIERQSIPRIFPLNKIALDKENLRNFYTLSLY